MGRPANKQISSPWYHDGAIASNVSLLVITITQMKVLALL